MCAGFKAGDGNAHHLANRGTEDVVYLEIGDRTAGDGVTYPDDDSGGPGRRQQVALHAQGRHGVFRARQQPSYT